MGSLLSLPLLILLSWTSFSLMNTSEAQGIKSTRLLDLLIRDYTFHSYTKYFRTGTLHTVNLPANFSGIGVHTGRFRCGSLKRYGAQVKEFNLGIGATVHPCVERVMVVTQNLGLNWSAIYYDNYELSGYQLVSPVLGLLAYNAGDDLSFSNPFEIGILAGKDPISIDFSNTDMVNDTKGLIPLCASFGHDGKVTLAEQVAQNVCVTTGHGHFGLVIESPLVPGRRRESQWKIVFGSSVGAALGAFLLSLLVIALFVKVKKKARMEEMERRAYEEEALQVTMVGHVRTLTGPGTRTTPAIEHEYNSPSPS
ncbi:Dihydrolipoyllysine-residue succinyltransferase component of 2-oxoglutarate dehydrogenase [Actinidia chinensis var. chinensis]|uniref:Dihydrolipoyllysine-residue succinyltransferase component of 2-oxoglutarate dehydrogenase n=1 Tax=Actinidia chinensis var. chinensis TaxID=1590841 RepID=A0A2R6QNG8_ACTCC|nr:Dihydrolipoyllysine-residue succinyltransferase component of 2-oxoglutarate dehydrogenase [Actinidia chinensis var. chinensis]